MSYYHALTDDQIMQRKQAYQRVTIEDGSAIFFREAFYNLAPHELDLVTDYIGYLVYRALRLKQKYNNKTATILKYMKAYDMASEAMAGLIKTIGMDAFNSLTNKNAHCMMERFLQTEDL
jgi:hypothetical protein